MKQLKKVLALVIALAMVFALTATAFADATGDVYTGSNNAAAIGVAGTTQIPLKKTIIFINENDSTVYEPNITYTYTVAPHDPDGATVTDNDGDQAVVNPGVTGGVVFASGANQIAFSDANTAATYSTGNEIEHGTNMTVVFGASGTPTFQHAGIYRYVITETTTAADVAAVGIERDTTDYDSIRYMDVYIGNGGTVDTDTNPLGLQLLGAVIFKTVETNAGDEGKDSIDTTFEKTTGFEPGVAGTPGTTDYTNDTTVDRYTTYDFTVKKEVAGSLADKTNEFPFYVNVTNTIDGAKYTYYDDPGTGSGAAEDISGTSIAKGSNSASSALTLKHGDYIKFVGVPSSQSANLSVDVKEWNNTVDEYTLTVAASSGGTLTTNPANGKLSSTAGTEGALAAAFDLKTNDAADQTITFTNTLSEISPTGYVVRIAPYAIMLGLGIALLMITRRRKDNEEEAAAA